MNSGIGKIALKISLGCPQTGTKLARLDPELAPTWLHLAHLDANGGLNRNQGHIGARRAPKSSTPRHGHHSPGKLTKNHKNNSNKKTLIVLNRICRKWCQRPQLGASLPRAPGVRITVV